MGVWLRMERGGVFILELGQDLKGVDDTIVELSWEVTKVAMRYWSKAGSIWLGLTED